jgi:urease accessory protein
MSSDPNHLLLMLQHGDSFFPSGGVSFSWGLEGLCDDGELGDSDALFQFVVGQLRGRWGGLDRPIVVAAHRSAFDLTKIVQLDVLLDAMTLSREFREASRKLGGALLAIHRRLKTDGAQAYFEAGSNRSLWPHLAVAQGILWRRLGLKEDAAAAMSGYAFCTAFLSAAIRLGLLGHVQSQSFLAELGKEITIILKTPPADIQDIGAFTPHADIASMRHETRHARLFSN